MGWPKAIGGIICVLVGAGWIGQGVGLLPGTLMSGQLMWAVIGLVLVVVGVWLLWSFARGRRSIGSTRA
jgi:hypothetical protein